MGLTFDKTLLDRPAGALAGFGLVSRDDASIRAGRALRRCFHCGEPCTERPVAKGEKAFCCQGCLAVHDILAASGLDHFYQLADRPGVRVLGQALREHWAYLDESAVQERLLDFTDGKLSRVTFHLPAIHCVACVWLLENLFRLHSAIGESRVNFPRREATITFAAAKLALSELAALLSSIGYEPHLTLKELEKTPADPRAKRRWLQIGVAGFAFGNIMLFSIPAYLGLDSFSGPLFARVFGWLSLALGIPVLAYSASDYWRGAWLSVRQRVLTLDVPLAVGLAALYLQSAFEILSGSGAGYLDSLAGLVFFLLCGRAFQQKTYDRIAFDRDYKCFFPLSAIRKTALGDKATALSELRVGDRLLIRNGELIPADAQLVAGPALIDYSFVTGESDPVARNSGERLYAGGKQLGSAIEIQLIKEVSQSYLASLWGHEAFRKQRHHDLGTMTNRYSRRFTAAVILVALAAALVWCVLGDAARAVKAFTSVLIVACPCALALAAPFALGTSQRWLARLQIFLKNALVLERLARIDTIVFDKTGTLTCAGSTGLAFCPANSGLDSVDRNRLATLARHSTHPHSTRIADALSSAGTPPSGGSHGDFSGAVGSSLPAKAEVPAVSDFRELPGCGIEGLVDGRRLQLGSADWLRSQGLALPEIPGFNGTASCVAIEGEVRGAFVFKSSLRPKASQVVSRLARRYELALLSGDNEREREIFHQLFGPAARLHFNQSPLQKLEFISQLQANGRTVMMVGDGLNDAGALKQSDVGVAVVERMGAFSPASDVIMPASEVPRLADLLELGRKAARVVRVSFAISAVYNLAGIGIAAAGLLSPLICAVLMPLSSVSVVLFATGAASRAARKSVFCSSELSLRTLDFGFGIRGS